MSKLTSNRLLDSWVIGHFFARTDWRITYVCELGKFKNRYNNQPTNNSLCDIMHYCQFNHSVSVQVCRVFVLTQREGECHDWHPVHVVSNTFHTVHSRPNQVIHRVLERTARLLALTMVKYRPTRLIFLSVHNSQNKFRYWSQLSKNSIFVQYNV